MELSLPDGLLSRQRAEFGTDRLRGRPGPALHRAGAVHRLADRRIYGCRAAGEQGGRARGPRAPAKSSVRERACHWSNSKHTAVRAMVTDIGNGKRYSEERHQWTKINDDV
eukprot:1189611-Prorocentrum_minimum.AAC.1